MIWESGDTKLLISAASPIQFPESMAPEVVMAGKSNVGKSSLINGLVNRKNLAYVGQRPGKTRLVNFYHICEELMLVDVPGYGFANRSHAEQIRYGELMDAYFSTRTQLKAVLLVVDVRRGLTQDDYLMIDVAKKISLPYMIVATKVDKLSYSRAKAQMDAMRKESGSIVVGFSALDRRGIDEIREMIERWVEA